MINIRPETSADHEVVYHVNQQVFDQTNEADLVEALRRQADPYVSLVAEAATDIVGHIFFSPVEIEFSGRPVSAMGLAPMAVRPEWQRQGIGTELVREGLEVCRRLGADVVVVLGHPEYYSRFGFRPAVAFGLQCEYDVPDEAFMAMELTDGALQEAEGTVRFHPAFGSIG